MRFVRLLALISISIAGLAAEEKGLMPRWEVTALAKTLQNHANEVQRLLGDVRPKEWIQDGAPQSYVEQYEDLIADLDHLELSAVDLENNPEKLSRVVDTFLWLDRLHGMIDSMAEGVRRYQNAPVAVLLASARDRNAGAEAQLKEYMQQLALALEQKMEIAHSEAQRCRGQLARRPGVD